MMSKIVEIFEVGPRDGLQNEPVFIALADKIALTEALARTGLPRIECASFVSPKWVPQMVDCAAVVTGTTPGLAELYALAPNTRGLQDALQTPVQGICVFIAATEGFSRANTNISLAGAVERVQALITEFKKNTSGAIKLRGYISCVTECPYDGAVDPSEVARLAEKGKTNIAVCAPAFSADCIETLEEINEEIKESFEEAGGEHFTYIPCLNDNDAHMDALSGIVQRNLQGWLD